MDKAVVLGAAGTSYASLLADKAVRAGLAVGDGIVVEIHAHVLFEMAAALTHKAARGGRSEVTEIAVAFSMSVLISS